MATTIITIIIIIMICIRSERAKRAHSLYVFCLFMCVNNLKFFFFFFAFIILYYYSGRKRWLRDYVMLSILHRVLYYSNL